MSKVITKQNAQAFKAGMNSTTGAKVWNELFASDKKKQQDKEQEAKRKIEQQKLAMTRF